MLLPRNLTRQNSGYSMLLVLVDLFSRLTVVVPIKRKTTGAILSALAAGMDRLPFRVTGYSTPYLTC